MHSVPAPTPAWLSTWMSASAAVFLLLMLSVPSGYSVGGGLLLVGGVATWLVTSTVARGRVSITAHGAGDAAAGVPWRPAAWTREDHSLCWLLAAMFLVNAVAVLWHGDSGKYLDQGLRYLLAVPILLGLRRARLRLDWLRGGLALGLIAAAVVAGWQIRQPGIDRAEGFLTSAIPFGDIALVMGFWCLMGAILAGLRRRHAWALMLLVGSLAGAYAFIASATRGGLLAVPVLLILAAIVILRRQYFRPLFIGGTALVMMTVILLVFAPVGQLAETRYAGIVTEWKSYSEDSVAATSKHEANNVGTRLEAWKAALISIPERPLLGWGHAEYEVQAQHLVDAKRVAPIVIELSNTHNNFLEIWLHQGIVGLIAFLALLITSFWYFCRRLRAPDLTVRVLACCGASLPAAFACFGLTQVILGRNNGVMFFVLSLAILWAAMRQAEAEI